MKEESENIRPNDPEEMKISRKYSFLCRIFQKNKLNVFEKQEILKRMMRDHQRKQNEEAIA